MGGREGDRDPKRIGTGEESERKREWGNRQGQERDERIVEGDKGR